MDPFYLNIMDRPEVNAMELSKNKFWSIFGGKKIESPEDSDISFEIISEGYEIQN